jgi:hypothetical protein
MVSHETFWYDSGPKPYKATYTGSLKVSGIAQKIGISGVCDTCHKNAALCIAWHCCIALGGRILLAVDHRHGVWCRVGWVLTHQVHYRHNHRHNRYS